MNQLFSVSSEAYRDLFEIWRHISSDSVDLADRIDAEFLATFESLGLMPGQGHVREDLTTKRILRFFPLHSYLIIYQHDARPIRIVAVLRGKRNIKRILRERL